MKKDAFVFEEPILIHLGIRYPPLTADFEDIKEILIKQVEQALEQLEKSFIENTHTTQAFVCSFFNMETPIEDTAHMVSILGMHQERQKDPDNQPTHIH